MVCSEKMNEFGGRGFFKWMTRLFAVVKMFTFQKY